MQSNKQGPSLGTLIAVAEKEQCGRGRNYRNVQNKSTNTENQNISFNWEGKLANMDFHLPCAVPAGLT